MAMVGTRFALLLRPLVVLFVAGVCCAQGEEQQEEESDVDWTEGGQERGPNSTLALLVEVGRVRGDDSL